MNKVQWSKWLVCESLFSKINYSISSFNFVINFRISLKKNNEDVVSAFSDVSGFHTSSTSAILQLSTTDRVYLQLQEGRVFEASTSSRSYTTFTGFRIL